LFFCISDDQLSCFCICNIHLSFIYLKILKNFVDIIPVRVFKERKIKYYGTMECFVMLCRLTRVC